MTWLVILSWCSRMHIRRSRWELPCSYRCWQRFQSTFWLKYGSSVYKKGKNQEVIYVWTYECYICIFLHLNDILVLSLGRICRGKKKKKSKKKTNHSNYHENIKIATEPHMLEIFCNYIYFLFNDCQFTTVLYSWSCWLLQIMRNT